jgi:putative spermidine/putrescine transport system substrate-binding protein/spermidine/putrescine transport system substrate-binding protein
MTHETTREGTTIAWMTGLMALTLAAFSTGAQAQDTLRILTWEGLADDAWIEPFEEEHDVEVRRTYVGSNDEYMSALAAGDTQYDTVVIVSSLGRNAIEAGFVEPLDLDRIPNFQRIYPEFAGVDFLRGDGEQYGVPTFWDIQPVTINADVVEECSFDVLFDEQYKGKIAMWDDVSTIGDVAAYMGYENIWTLSDEELDAVKNKLVAQAKLVRRYWSTGGEVVELFSSGEVVATNSWSYITQQLRDEGMNAEQCAPERPTAWLDSHFIVKGTDNRELAHAFVDYMLEPEVLAQVAETSGFGVTVPDALDHLDAGNTPSVMQEDDEFRQSIHFWEEIPRRGRYLEIWNEVKAGT